MFNVSKFLFAISLSSVLLACGSDTLVLTPENVSDQNLSNGINIQKEMGNGFFVKGTPDAVKVPVGTKLSFAKSGERAVVKVVVTAPYINIYVDKPLDPIGDGYPNKVTVASH